MKTKDLCLMALFASLLTIGAFIKLPISIVPVTLQTFFVTLIALVLPRKCAVGSVVLYITMGLIGLPVFASGSGPSYVLQPSFGYLLGFVVCVFYMTIVLKENDNITKVWIVSLVGLMIIYVLGMTYFYIIQMCVYNMNYTVSWMMVYLFLVYLPGDLISMAVAIFIYKRVKKVIDRG